jgi:ubiquinone/menaquinone biosynthesis C-methylase UbiE
MIHTCIEGLNADILAAIEALYFKPGMVIADVTYGSGLFWTKIDTAKYDFRPTDLLTGVDFRSLPYKDNSIDVLVIDPPYIHGCSDGYRMHTKYNNKSTADLKWKGIMQLYYDGMAEARRVLKNRGYLLIKCQDEIEGRQQRFSHITLHNTAVELHYNPVDLLILHQRGKPSQRHKTQDHARKNHSYMWVFKNRKGKLYD